MVELRKRLTQFLRRATVVATLTPGLAFGQYGFATYRTVLESYPVATFKISPEEEARRYIRERVDRGRMPATNAEREIARMAAALKRSRGRITLQGETVGGQKDGLLYYSTVLPFSSHDHVEPKVWWEMMRNGVTYQKGYLNSLNLSANDDMCFLASAGLRWLFTGVPSPTTPPIRAIASGRSVHNAATRPLNQLEKAQELPPLVERIEIDWQRGHPRRILIYRGWGGAELRFRVQVDEWRGSRPARFTVEEMWDATTVSRRLEHTLRNVSQELPRPLAALTRNDRVIDYRLSPERPYGYAWVGHIVPLDLLREQIAKRAAATRRPAGTDWRPLGLVAVGGTLLVVGILLRAGRVHVGRVRR